MFLGLLLLAAGCHSTMETGYQPQPLTATDAERRAYYASPFSPESHVAPADHSSDANLHRPGSY